MPDPRAQPDVPPHGLAMRATAIVIARSLSILGHPLVVVPAAVATLVLHGRTPSAGLIVSAVCGIAGAVLVFSFWQVRRGRWQHIDASVQGERRSLNLFLARVPEAMTAIAGDLLIDRGINRRRTGRAEQLLYGPPDDRRHYDPPHPRQRSKEAAWLCS